MLADQLALEFPRCKDCILYTQTELLLFRKSQMGEEEIIIRARNQLSECW